MKTKYRNLMKRGLALFLCLVMMLGTLPTSYAAGDDSTATPSTVGETAQPQTGDSSVPETGASTDTPEPPASNGLDEDPGAAAAPADEPAPVAELTPRLTVSGDSNDGVAAAGDTKVSFTVKPSYTLDDGEELPEGATVEYSYNWQYAERRFSTSWWGSKQEQNLTESDWKVCKVEEADKESGTKYFDDYAEDVSYDALSDGVAGEKLVITLPDGIEARETLANLAIRCKVAMTIKAADGTVLATDEADYARKNMDFDESLTSCVLSVSTAGSVTALVNANDELTLKAVPTLTNAPADASFSYTWQYKDGSRWRAIDYNSSPIKTATITSDNSGSMLVFTMPTAIADREDLRGLQVRCKVTANAGSYSVSGSPSTVTYDAVTVDEGLLKYTLSVTSDNSGAAITSADSPLRLKVTPKLSGAADSFSGYSYNWQYLRADDPGTDEDESGWVSVNDAASPFRRAVASSGKESVLTMSLPEDLDERAALRGQTLRCVVTVSGYEVEPDTVYGDVATVSIPDRLLSSCTLDVAADAANNSDVNYPGQLLRWQYNATVGGAKPEDAILVYNWTFNGRPLESVSAFNGFEYVTDDAGHKIGVILTNTSDVNVLKALDDGTVKCEIKLYENNDRYQNNDETHGFTESKEATITVNEAIVANYTKAGWLTYAWLNVNTDVKSDAIVNVGDEAVVEMIFDLGYTKNLTPEQQMQEGRYVPNLDETYDRFALKYNWEYRENESQPWKPVQQLIDKMEDKNCLEIVQFYDGTEDTRANIGKTGFNVSFTNATSYADRNLLSGTQFRCTASALVLADEPDPNNNSETISTPWGVVSASVPDSQVLTVIINPKLLRSQVSSVRRITGFLTKDAADLWLNEATRDSVNLSDPNNIYNSSKSYEVKYFQDGVREERATADFPTSIVAVYEYQVSTGIDSIETRTAAVEIPVPWRFIVQNGRQYDLAATKAEYRYDAVLAEIIPQWNSEALQDYINSHDPNDLDYDEDAATKWVVAAGLNGRFPHVKVCWNTELAGLASNADYVKYNKLYGSGSDQTEKDKVAALAGSPVNPSAKDTLSDWYFHADQYPGKTGANEPMTEADQLQWLNEHYNTVKVTMDDVQSDLADPTPIVKELPISWKKVEINEYDTNSQSMTSRWLGDEATGVIQGISAAAAKWGWQATIDAVENGDYVASVGLRNTPVEANIYWSNVIDGIVGAVATNSVTATKETYRMLSNAASVDSNILPYLRVEYKDANGGTNIQAVVPIDKANWKVVDGGFAVADTSAPRGYSWTHPTKDDPYTSSTVPSAANAGYITLEPELTGFTFTENADTTEAQVAYQWGTIITELMKSDGVSPYDPLMAAKTPIQIIPQIGGNDQTQAQWAKISAKFSKSFKTTIMDVSKTSGSSASTAAATWTKPNYNESTPAGKIQPGVKIDNYASGIVFGEDFLRDLGSRDIYGEASWKIAVPSVKSGSSDFIKWNSDSGQPYVSGKDGQKTVYADRPWECYYSTNTTGAVRQQTANFAPGAQDTWQNSANNDGVKYMVTTSSRGGGAYVEWSVTFRNDSTGTRYVGLSYGSDVMIHSNDRAPLTKTETGFKMEEAQGDSCQFNINCTTATAGISVSADTRWIGHYSSRQHWTEAGGNYVSGIDSGLTFSWIPANHSLQPGEQVTFTCQFGIGKMSDPPRMVPHYDSGSGRSTDVTMRGSELNVSAWLAGDNKYPMTLYYILDEGLPTQQSEASVGGKQTPGGVVPNSTFSGWSTAQKTAYFRTGTDGHFKQFTGEIEKPRDWVAGEYHTITLFGLSDAGLMTDSVKFPLYVTENESGDEVFTEPTVATVSFTKGSAGGGTVSGSAPAAQSAHLQEPIQLPKGTGMSASGYKFVGWDYNKPVTSYDEDGNPVTTRKLVTYPAETYFYVQEHPTTLSAKWIPSSQTMYLVETYMQNSAGEYEQGDTVVAIAPAGSGNIVYTPETIKGYSVNTGKSTLSVPRTDGATVKVYYDINKYNVVFNVNDAPTTAPDGSVNAFSVFRTVSVPYGGNVSGIPNAAQLNAGKNNNFFTFIGWFTKPDTSDRGDLIDTDTIVNETTLRAADGSLSADPGSVLNAYSHWRPNGSAQISFDYGYVNHAQGASRTDRVKLNPVESAAGKYGYGSVTSKMPRTPSAWKDTSGKVFTFKEWRIVDSSKPEAEWKVFTRDTVLPNYENYTVRAFWEESYTVSRSTQGNGRVWDINDPADGEKSYAPGDSVDIRWRADAGNYVQHVYIDNVLSDELIKNGGWHLDDVGGQNHSVYVVFGEGDGDSGLEEETTYNITATPAGGVAFTAPPRGGTYKASFGENYTVKWSVSPGYVVASVTVNGLPMDVSEYAESSSGEYQFNDIHTDQEIVVTAVRTDGTSSGGSVLNRGPYTISTKIAKGTSITPAHTVNYGGSSTVTWRLPFGFVVDRIYVNNVQLHDLPTDNSYTFKNVAMNSNIQVICKPDDNLAQDAIYVSTTIDDGGSITPTTPVGLLSRGDNHTVTWSVNPGYYVLGVSIDNVLQKTESGANKIFYSYTFNNIQEPHDVVVAVKKIPAGENQTFTVSTSMVNGGSIINPGAVASGSDVTVTWTMAANHHVTGVYLDNQLVDDYDMSAKPNSYTIKNITANHSLRVECARDEAEEVPDGSYTVTTSINLGSADARKIVTSGSACTVNWTPPRGYHLDSITVNGTAVNGVTGNSYTIPSVTENTNVVVHVVKDDNFYTLNTSIVNGGTVTGGGDYATNMKANVSWTVAPGFRVTDVTLDGVSIAGIDYDSDTSYTFNPPNDAKGKTYELQVVCAPELYYSVRTVGTGCVDLTPDTNNILLGQDHTVTWKIADGYKFISASVDDAAITPVVTDGLYSYTFDGDVPSAGQTYMLKVICQPIPAYTITTGRNTGGTVSPSKTILETDENKTYTVEWSANTGYVVKSVTLNDAPYTGTNYVFDFANGRNDKLVVEFAPRSYYTVAVTGNNASILSGSGSYLVDQDATVTWNAPTGFVLDSVKVNNTDVTANVATEADGTVKYVIDHNTVITGSVYNVVVTYVADGTGGGDEPEEPKYYSIDTDGVFTASITPDGTAELGEDYTVNWKVAAGYALQSVTVDGTELTASDYTRAADGTYTYLVTGAGRQENDTVKVEIVCVRDNTGGEAVTPYSVYGRSNDDNLGTVTPANVTLREPGTTTTVRWQAKFGCHVVKVTESEYSTTEPNNRANSRDLSEAEVAAGQIVFNYDTHKDLVYDVEFARDPQYTVSVLAAGNVGEGCTVTANGGTAPVTLSTAGDSCSVTWTTVSGYTISAAEVLSGNTVIETLTGSSKTFNYADLTGDITVRVTYAKDPTQPPYSVHASCNNTAMGTVAPAVKNLTEEHSTTDVTWAAEPGYRVRSVVVSDYPSGSNARTLSASERDSGVYTFKYDDGKDINIYVSFEALTAYTVTVNKIGGGAASSVSGGGTMNIAGQTSLVTWAAGAGYKVKSVDIIDYPTNGTTSLTAAQLAASSSYLVEYDKMSKDCVINVEFEQESSESKVASVITSVNDASRGWISPSTDLYTAGSEYMVNWGANDGYQVVGVVINGVSQTLPLPTNYLFKYNEHKDDAAPTEIQVNFAPLPQYTITTQKIAGGANSTVRDGTTLTRHGETYAVTWVADAGFEVDSIVITNAVNGDVLKTLNNDEIAAGKYTFAYDEMQVDEKLTVTFKTSAQSIEATPFSVTTSVNDPAMGTVDPSMTLRTPGSEYVVTWAANPGYEVDKVYVSDGTHSILDEYTGRSYTFKYADGADATVNVVFKEIPKYTLTTLKQGNGGAACTVSDGTVLSQGQSYTVTWHANTGYTVKSIAITLPDGTDRRELDEDQIAAGNYTISYDNMNGSDRRFVVTFQKDETTTPGGDNPTPYSVTTSVNDETMGSVSPSKTLRAAGETYEITWTANPGYRVKLVTVDGRVHNFNLNSSYTFRYDDYVDSVVKVTFAPIEKYTVTAAKVGGGAASSVSPASGVLSKSGDTHTVTWTAGDGYKVKSVVVTNDKGRVLANATEEEIAAGSYTISYDDMTSDQTVTVTFDKTQSTQPPYSINTSVNDSTMGWVDPSVTLTVPGEAVIDWAANPGYRVKYVTLANPDGTGSTRLTDADDKPATSYTFRYVSGSADNKDLALTVYFEKIPEYTVTAAKIGGGSVSSVLPATGTLTRSGEEHTVTWTADTGYLTSRVQIFRPNNSLFKTLTAEEIAAGSYTFKYDEMPSDLRVEVTFIKDIPYSVSVGTVGSGTVKIDDDAAVSTKSLNAAGQTAKVTWQAAEGWHFAGLTVNGVEYTPETAGEYIFKYDSQRDERVVVTFAANDVRTTNAVLEGQYGLSTISPASTSMNKSTDNVTVTWTIDSAYEITGAEITDDDGAVVKTLTSTEIAAGSYSFAYDTMSGNETLTVTVEKKTTGGADDPVTPYTITTGLNDSTMGTISAGSTLTAGTYEVTWSANDGYHIDSVTHKIGDDVQAAAPTSPYTFSYDTAKANDKDESIYVEFARNAGYAVNVNVTGSGTAAMPTVLHSGSYTVWWKPNEGAELDTVTVTNYDGESGTKTLTDSDWHTAADGDGTGLEAGTQYFVFEYSKMSGDATINISFKDKDYYYVVVSGQNVESISADHDKIDKSNPVDSLIKWKPVVDNAILTGFSVGNVDFVIDATGTSADENTIPVGNREFNLSGSKLADYAQDNIINVKVMYTLPEPEPQPEPENFRVDVITHAGTTTTASTDVPIANEYTVDLTPPEGYSFVKVDVNGVTKTVPEGGTSIAVGKDDVSEANGIVTVDIYFESVDPDAPVTYTVTANKSGSGTVKIDNNATITSKTLNNAGESATVTWEPDEGYRVKNVTLNSLPYRDESGNIPTSYTFEYKAIEEGDEDTNADAQIFVEFEPMPQYNINVTKVGNGNVTGAGVMTYTDTSRNVKWTAENGWHIASVSVDGVTLPDVLAQMGQYTVRYSDFSDTRQSVNFVVTFERDDLPTPPATNGHTLSTTYEGSGTVTDGITLTEANGGYVHTVTWNPAEGWRVKSAEVYKTEGMSLIDTLPATGDNAKYDFSYADPGKDVTLKVVFEKDEVKQFNVTVIAGVGGTVTSDSTKTLSASGEQFKATWSENAGYHVTGVFLNGVECLVDGNIPTDYTFKYDDMLAASMPTDNLLEIKLAANEVVKSKYLISTNITPGVSGSVSSSAIVEEGDRPTVTWTVNPGYNFKSVTVDGAEVTPDYDSATYEYSYTFDAVDANHSVVVTCEVSGGTGGGETDEFFDIVSGISNGTMSDGKTIRSIHKGEDYTLSWSPNPGFYVESVTIDGENKGAITSHTFKDITADHTVEVVCKSLAESDLYYVNVSVVDITKLDENNNPLPSGGAVTNGNRELTVGTDHTVTWSAASGYEITGVVITDKDGNELASFDAATAKTGTYDIKNAVKNDEFNVRVSVQPKEEGVYHDIIISSMNAIITGNTHVKDGESTTISWEPEFGYAIKSIVIDDSARPITLESFTFNNVTADHSVTVICERLDPDKEYVISTHITDGGTITAPVTVKTEEQKASQTITWTPAAGFVVDKVKIDGVIRTDLVNAGSYTFTDIEDDHSVDVECKIPEVTSFNITATNDNGTISAVPAVVNSGESSTVTWKPADGFKLDSVTVDGISLDRSDYTKNADGSYSYTFSNVTTNHTIEVTCVLVDSNANYSVSTSIGNGTITPSFTVDKTDTAAKTVTWTVADGYRVVRVEIDGVENTSLKNAASVNLGRITENRTVSVITEAIPSFTVKADGVNVVSITPTTGVAEGTDHTVTWMPAADMELQSITVDDAAKSLSDCTANADGTYSYTFTDVRDEHSIKVVYGPKVVIKSFTINTHISDGGTITAPVTLVEGSDKRVEWTAPEGYTVKTVKLDGTEYPELKDAGSYTFVNIIADHTVDVICEAVPVPAQYNITASNNGGMITADPATVTEGGSSTVTWSGTEGLVLKSVSVDGTALNESDYTDHGDGTMSYTLTDITADHSVNVIYERDADAPVDPDVESFYILTSIDNGSITPTVTVTTDEEKASQTITWTPADGYRITGVTVDDAAIADFDPAGGAYEFTNITADHSVNVSCEKIPVYTVRTDGVNVSTITPTTTDIREGESFTVTWTPAAGMALKDFKVDNVSVTLADGATSYTFDDIKANHRVYVEYGADVVEPETPDKVEISVMVTNGVKTGGGILRYGTASHTVTWAPSNGFVVKSVTIDNVPVPESTLQPNGGSFTFTSITADHSVVVVCEKEESGDTRKYYLEANIVNGLYDPYSMYGVYPDPEIRDGFAPGENFEISWAANDGYKVASVELDGVSRPDLITAGKLSLIGIRSDHALNVVCIDENDEPVVNEGPFTITTAINHGTISPTFTTTDKQNYYTVDWTADEAYEVVNVLVDGNAYPNWADGYITFNPITANHTVEVYAQLKEQPKDGEYVIDIIIDNGGTHDVTVDGKSVTVVKENSSAVASWQAAEGYDVSRIVIDGVSYTGLPGCTAQGGSYTFNKVTAGHRIVIYTTKHVEKPAVYYSISVLPYGDPNNVDLIAEAGGQSGKSLVAVLDDSEAAVHWNAKAGWKIDKVTRNDNIMTDAEVAAGMSDEGFRFKVNSDNNFVVYISEVKRVDESFLTVTTQITNGTISSGCSVQKGKSVDVTWLPNNGYEMTKVEITTELVDENGKVSTQTETYTDLGAYKYTLDNIQGNTTVSVTCEKAAENVKHSYQISSEVTNGTVTGTGTVVAGTSQMLTWMPAEGCSVSSVELYKVDDNGNIIAEVDISDRDGNSFTIADVDANYLLVLVCENNSHSDDDFFYDINTSITNGTINGPFLNLKKNGGALVEWMPNEGYHVKELRVDGVTTPIPADYSLEVMVEGEDHTVEVICEKDEPIVIQPDDVTRYVKTFIYDGSGEITPTTQVVVGSDFTVRWKPDDNLHYKVDRVYINGVNIPTPANNMTTLHIEELMDENGDPKDYTVEVYLVENLVHVNVKYEGKGDVVKSGTVYYNEDFGIVQGIANVDEGYKLEKVYVNNVLLQPGEILVDYLPDPDSPLPLEQNPSSTSFAAKARKALNSVLNVFFVSASAADETNWDTPENRARVVDPVSGLQNTFYFKNVTDNQTVDYVFTDENGATDYAPYNVSVELIDGRGERDVARDVAPGATDSIGWTLEDGFYIDHIGIFRDGRETDINSVQDAVLGKDASGKDIVTLSNIQATTVVKVYLGRGEAPASTNDFSLKIDIVGPGSSDPTITFDGAGMGLAPGDHTAIWNVGSHKVTKVTVDGTPDDSLIGKDRVTITMSEDDESHDHKVIVYLDGEVMPNLVKTAGNAAAKVGSTVPYTITVSNDSDNAIWQNVTISDTIPAGLDVDTASLKLYRVAEDGSKTEDTATPVNYDPATRVVSAEVGNIEKTDKFEIDFNATINVDATSENIGNSVTAAGKLYGYDDDVTATAGPVYPGGSAEVMPANPEPRISKTVVNSNGSTQNTRVGDELTYTIEVWNEKAGSLWKSVKLQDVLPNGLEFIDGSLTIKMLNSGSELDVPAGVSVEYDAANNTITATLGDIDSSKHYRISFRTRVSMDAVGADIGNIALAAGLTPERRAANVETESVYPFEADKGGVLPKAPNPRIVKTVRNLDRTGEMSQIGDTLEYRLLVSNEELDTVWKNAVIRDRIPEGLEIDTGSITLTSDTGTVMLDASVYNADSRLLSVFLGDIAGGERYTLSFNATVTESPEDYDIGNYAWANGKDPNLPGGDDPVPGTDDDTKPGDPYFPPDGGDEWVDNGGPASDKVYPDEADKPTAPGPMVVKTSNNLVHPLGDTATGDIIEYQIEITNTQPNSKWSNVTIVDTLPEELSPEDLNFMLIHPDGTIEELSMEEHYYFRTHAITVELAEPVHFGESYYLRYRTSVNASAYVAGTNDEIINTVTATGTGIGNAVVEVSAENSIRHPGTVTTAVRTGDDSNIAAYAIVMMASAMLCGAVLVIGKSKGKKEED